MDKAIIFDMDGVVADTEEAYRKASNKMMEGLSVNIGKKEWFKRFPGRGPVHTISTIFREHGLDMKEGIDYWVGKLKEEYNKIAETGGIKPVRGFLEFNRKLNKLKAKKIIATGSYRKSAQIVLESFGIEKEFEVISIEDIRKAKPNPRIFLAAAERLGSGPEDCIVFEDAPVGIAAAKAAGMKCIALTTSTPRDVLEKENPDLVIDDYTELGIEKLQAL